MWKSLWSWFCGNFSWWVIASVVSWGITRLFMKFFGKSPGQMKKEIALFLIFFVGGVALLASVTYGLIYQPQASSMVLKGGLKWQIILCGPSGPVVTSTNVSLATISSENAGLTKIGSGISILFIVRIVNTGPDTTAWNWKAGVAIPGGSTLEGTIPSVSELADVILPTVIGPYKPTKDNNLLQVLSTHPLKTGDTITGWLVMHVNGLDSTPNDCHFIVSFEDNFGRQIQIDDHWQPQTH
jgi:hypothetical protein